MWTVEARSVFIKESSGMGVLVIPLGGNWARPEDDPED